MKKEYLVFMGMGFELTALIIAGIYFGQHLDKTYSLKGLGVAGGCLLALVLWIFHLLRLVYRLNKSENERP